MRSRPAALVFVAGVVAGQSLGGLSGNCTMAAESLLTGPIATCLDIESLASVITTSGNTSIVPQLQSYVSTVCTGPPCNASDISAANATVMEGCATDIAAGNGAAVALASIFADYNDTIGLLCSEYTTNGTYCLPYTLSAIQNATGTNITVVDLESLFSETPLNMTGGIPPSAICTACGASLFDYIGRLAGSINSSYTAAVQSEGDAICGAGFSNGTLPSSVSVNSTLTNGTASSASASSSATMRNRVRWN